MPRSGRSRAGPPVLSDQARRPSIALRDSPVAAAAAVGAIAIVAYLLTLAPDVAFGDWGEMQVVPHVLGIAHPTGYPTYVLLAWLTGLLPLGSPAFERNLLSAVCVALTLATSVLIAGRLGIRPLPAAAAALALGVVGTVWAAATVAEVNALHLLFASLLLHRALAWADHRRTIDLVLVGLLAGLAFGNHLLTVGIVPFVALYVAWTGRHEFVPRLRSLALSAAAAVAGLSVYLYIPIRAGQDPPLAYNHPTSLDDVIWLVSGRQFRDQFGFLSPEGPGALAAALPDLAALLVTRATLVLPALGLLGLLVLLRRHPAFGLTCLAILAAGVYLWATYLRLEHYLLVSWLILAIGFAVALDAAAEALGRLSVPGTGSWRGGTVGLAGLLFATALAGLNVGGADRSTDRSGREYVDAVLGALPPDAVFLSYWDGSTPLWYAQLVDGRRPDVTVIDDTNIVYDGWGTRQAAIRAHLCARPVFILRFHEAEIEALGELFVLQPVRSVGVGAGRPYAVATRDVHRVLPRPPDACPEAHLPGDLAAGRAAAGKVVR